MSILSLFNHHKDSTRKSTSHESCEDPEDYPIKPDADGLIRTTGRSETDVLRIENHGLKYQLKYKDLEIEKLVAKYMREIVGNELDNELMNLDSSNGWGVDYREGVFTRHKNIRCRIKRIILKHRSFPIGSKPEGDFSSCIIIDTDDRATLYQRMEVSMLNYKVFAESDRPLDDLIKSYVAQTFQNHINKIRVLHRV